MTLDEFMKFIRTQPIDDYIVRIQYKYNHEDNYTYTNEYLYAYISTSGINYIWIDDWYEGQEDVTIIGFIPIEAVTIPKIDKESIKRKRY